MFVRPRSVPSKAGHSTLGRSHRRSCRAHFRALLDRSSGRRVRRGSASRVRARSAAVAEQDHRKLLGRLPASRGQRQSQELSRRVEPCAGSGLQSRSFGGRDDVPRSTLGLSCRRSSGPCRSSYLRSIGLAHRVRGVDHVGDVFAHRPDAGESDRARLAARSRLGANFALGLAVEFDCSSTSTSKPRCWHLNASAR